MFFEKSVFKSFPNFTGKHLCWSLFLKNLQAEGLQLHKIRLQHKCFPVKFAKFLRTPFLTEHLQWLLLHLLCFFKKVLFNSYFATLLWRTNNFFFSTHRLMNKTSDSFVYKFVVNSQVFEITPSGYTLWSWKLACLITWTILFKIPLFRYLSMCI